MPSPVSGTITVIVAEEGITVPMGAVIAEIHADDDATLEYVEQKLIETLMDPTIEKKS